MTPEQRAAYINAQAAGMLAELEAMKAANVEQESQGLALAYGEEAFFGLIDKWCVGHNAVISFFAE